jgi:hypothetical protein
MLQLEALQHTSLYQIALFFATEAYCGICSGQICYQIHWVSEKLARLVYNCKVLLTGPFCNIHFLVSQKVSSQKSGADPLVNPGQEHPDESSSGTFPQNIEKIPQKDIVSRAQDGFRWP